MNNLDCISSANRRYIIVFPVLVAFGVLYNAWIAKQEQSYKDEGRVSLYVVSGCAVTLSGAALLNWRGALIVFLCFVSSGLPMILGSLTRYFKLIERAERFIRQ